MELPLGDGYTLNYWRMTPNSSSARLGAGSMLEELTEPRATQEAPLVHTRRYDKTHRQSLLLAVKLRSP